VQEALEAPVPKNAYKGCALEPYPRQIERWVDAQPDITLAELQARLAEEEVVVSKTAIFRFVLIWNSHSNVLSRPLILFWMLWPSGDVGKARCAQRPRNGALAHRNPKLPLHHEPDRCRATLAGWIASGTGYAFAPFLVALFFSHNTLLKTQTH